MYKLIFCLLLYGACLSAQNFKGKWVGNLEFNGNLLKIVFNIYENQSGSYSASMDSPDQMAYDLPVDEVITEGNRLILKLNQLGASYEGKMNDVGQLIKGEWTQGMLNLSLDMKRSYEADMKRPQTPKAPFPYHIQEVNFLNSKADNIKLSGTLTLPENTTSAPAVILVSGSGPQDRDSKILKHQPFWVLADHLSRNGIAVLRYDDRGFAQSEGDHSTATTADFATDTEAAFEFLSGHPGIDPERISLIGHSEGGMIIQMVASRNKHVRSIISMAGPGIACDQLLLQQIKDLTALKIKDRTVLDKYMDMSEVILKAVKKDKKNKLNPDLLFEKCEKKFMAFTEEELQQLEMTAPILKRNFTYTLSPWYRNFVQFDPQRYYKRITCPVLALNGTKDLQVDAGQNLAAIKGILSKTRNRNFKCVKFKELNHLFQHCETGAVEEYANIEETLAPELMDEILGWLKAVNR